MGDQLAKNESFVTGYQDEVKMQPVLQLLPGLVNPVNKNSFLVFKDNKYFTVSIDKIAFFYVKYESSTIACFDGPEYFLQQSMNQIQGLVNGNQFFRLNRQYLINFTAIKEVEHYFARKLLVNLIVPVANPLLVTKEKVTNFLRWLDNR